MSTCPNCGHEIEPETDALPETPEHEEAPKEEQPQSDKDEPPKDFAAALLRRARRFG